MSVKNFGLFVTIQDVFLGSKIHFDNKRVELWKQEDGYDEFIASTISDLKNTARFSFDLSSDGDIAPPKVYLKIGSTDQTYDYVFQGSDLATITLIEGPNNAVALVNLSEKEANIDVNPIVGNAVITNTTGDPYIRLSIGVSILNGSVEVRDLGKVITNNLGFFNFIFTKDKELTALLDTSYSTLKFRFKFYSGDTLLEQYDKNFSTLQDLSSLIVININLDFPSVSTSISIDDLKSTLGLTFSADASSFLETSGITNLLSIRKVGGLTRIPAFDSLEAPDKTALAILDAHAQLETLSDDYHSNAKIIEKGYTAVYKIASTSREIFVKAVLSPGIVSEFVATNVYNIASAHHRLYTTVYTDRLMASRLDGGQTSINAILDLINDKCNCDDCEAAVSPLAYLSDLIWYAQSHLTIDVNPNTPIIFDYTDGPINAKQLQELFCRDFCLTTTQCDDINDRICQFRIAVEVLQCYKYSWLNDSSTSCQEEQFAIDERNYLTTSYYSLLEQLGTTYSELRSVSNSTDIDKKRELASNLGIIFDYTFSYNFAPPSITYYNTIDALYIDPNRTTLSNAVLGDYLELVFGLRNYKRIGCATSQPNSLVKYWKDKYLTAIWMEQDNNSDDYTLASSTDEKPLVIIDPDLIGPDDFRNPQLSNRAYSIWENRRKYLDQLQKDVFYSPSFNTNPGVILGYTEIVLTSSFPSYVGKQIKIVQSPGNNGVFTVTEAVSATTVRIRENLALPLAGTAAVQFEVSSDIISIDTAHSKIVVNGDQSSLPVGSFVEIRNSDVNAGIFKIVAVTYSGTQSTITLDRSLFANTSEFPNPQLVTTSIITISSASQVADSFVITGNHTAEIDVTQPVKINNSESLNGTYNITSVSSLGSDTRIYIKQQLSSVDSSGTLTYSSVAYTSTITPSMGKRMFVFEVPGMDVLFETGDLVQVRRTSGSPNLSDYDIVNVVPGTFSTITVAQPVYGNETAGRLIAPFAAEDFVSNQFTLSGFNLASLYDISNLERNKIEIAGVDYLLASVVNSGSDTVFTLDSSNTIDDGTYAVNVFFIIKQVDNSGKSFALPHPTLPSEISAGDKILINGGTGNSNNGIYTILDKFYDSSSGLDIYEVNEIVSNETVVTTGSTSFTTTVSLSEEHPMLDAIFLYWSTNSTFTAYIPTPTVTNPNNKEPWDQTWISPNTLIAKRDALLNGNIADSSIWDNLKLDRDSFIALANIYEKYLNQLSDPSAPEVTDKEYADLFNILLVAVKNNLAKLWFGEEAAGTAVKLNYNDFWISLTQPKLGELKIFSDPIVPLIDPQINGLSKLPDYIFGQPAIAIYNKRNDLLSAVRNSIRQTRLNYGFDQMLAIGLGGVSSIDALPINLSQTLQQLGSINLVDAQKAEIDITSKLFISVDDFRFIMDVRGRLSGTNPPTNDEFEKLYGILLSAYKVRNLYGAWKAEEVTFLGNYNYWKASKMSLPTWRSSIESRAAWQNALITRQQVSSVDPDLVFPEDFNNFNNAAYTLWTSRHTTVTSDYNALAGTSLDGAISDALVISITDFELLEIMEDAGLDIRPRLSQLCLTYQSYKRLVTLRAVTVALLPSEKTEFINILVQAKKQMLHYGPWNDEETSLVNPNTRVYISPVFFKKNALEYNGDQSEFYQKLPLWRATWKSRREWEQTLKSRIERTDDLNTSFASYIETVETQTLPLIRDALVMFCGDEYATLNDNAKKLSDRFLMDFTLTCCQHTTRIASAIDVLQKLIWSESLQIDRDIQLNPTTTLSFILHADNFEEEWKWMGSYATWRAAMFVFMYPENLLLPTLKRSQSPGFIKLISDIRGNNRLTPLAACTAARAYKEYFEDVTNLEAQASCNTTVTKLSKSCTGSLDTSIDVNTFFAFSINRSNKKAYWHSSEDDGASLSNISFWQQIEGLGVNVQQIIGTSVYQIEEGFRYIYLFAIVHEDFTDKLVFIRYDLEKQFWDQEYSELTGPEDADFSTIKVLQRYRETARPKLLIRLNGYKGIFTNYLNKKGTDWQNDEWTQITSYEYGRLLETINDYVEYYFTQTIVGVTRTFYGEFIVAKPLDSSNLRYRFLSNNDESESYPNFNDDGTWRTAYEIVGDFKGLVYTEPGVGYMNILVKSGGSVHEIPIKAAEINQPMSIKSFGALDGWQQLWTKTSLFDLPLKQEDISYWFIRIQIVIFRITNDDPTVFDADQFPANLGGLYNLVTRYARKLQANTGYNTWRFKIDDAEITFGDFIQKFLGHLPDMIDWVYNDYILKSDDFAARDIKWGDKKLIESFVGYYDGSIYHTNPNSAEFNLGSVLKNLISYIRWTNNDLYNSGNSNIYNLYSNHGAAEITGSRGNDTLAPGTTHPEFSGLQKFLPNSGKIAVGKRHYNSDGQLYNYAATLVTHNINGYNYIKYISRYHVNPSVAINWVNVTEEQNSADLQIRKTNICLFALANSSGEDPLNNKEYLREAWYFLPMFIGIELSKRGYYKESLQWFKTVYDYTTAEPNRIIYDGLHLDSGDNDPDWDRDMTNWLLNPLDPHGLATTRYKSYLKYTVSTIAQTFSDYASSEFAIDNVESVSRAKELYEFAESLIELDIFKLRPDACDITQSQLGDNALCELRAHGIDINIYKPVILHLYGQLNIKGLDYPSLQLSAEALKDKITLNAGTAEFDLHSNLTAATDYINSISVPDNKITISKYLDRGNGRLKDIHDAVMSLPEVEKTGQVIKEKAEISFSRGMEVITGKSAGQLTNKNISIPWLGDVKQKYVFNYTDSDKQALLLNRGLSFVHPTTAGAYTVSYNIDPHAALAIVNKFPFPYVPNALGIGENFCVPPNPTYSWLDLSIQLNLFKIKNCMNIAGMKRELDAYAAPTDTTTGLPQIGSNGQLVLPGLAAIRPTIYRYEVIIERAKQLVSIAQQLESAFLSALEKRDAEYYNLMRAKQDLALSRATVTLKQLQTKVANDQVDLANLQKEKSEIQVQGLDDMINASLNEFEQAMIMGYANSAQFSAMSQGLGLAGDLIWKAKDAFTVDAAKAVASGVAYGGYAVVSAMKLGYDIANTFTQMNISIDSIRASQARREQEWGFQKTLAQQDIRIGQQQIKTAQDGVRVAGQEEKIANLQQQNGEDTVSFLSNKFTNVDLYDWMSGVLENVYSYFLQEATGVAKMAQNQIAFERQEAAQAFIQSDYWENPTDNNAIQTPGANAQDRRGLTGSARLLQDIYRLDEYAFDSDKRKLQITKTFSLASIAPMDFQMFKESGELSFVTLMDYFDQDFPGHYLRLIKKVKVNVVALVPPTQGIKATLTSSGISRVTIGGNVFQDVIIRRDPEMIALSGSRESSGMFELQAQDSKYLNPFEDSGVNMNWQFSMPKASNLFDYSSIADVLVTIDYTALYDSSYAKQVNNRLQTDFSSDRAFSFRNEFSDAFYQWSHPEEFEDSSLVEIDVSKFDFPANVSDLAISQLKFYVLTDESDPDNLVFDDPSGKKVEVKLTRGNTSGASPNGTVVQGSAGFNNKGIVSTLTNGGSLVAITGSPVGKWQIRLDNLTDDFVAGRIWDVIMVITYEGTLPKR